ncbi:MAG: hypothetical protein AB7O80_00445 [Acetobacteraceae bacterium]
MRRFPWLLLVLVPGLFLGLAMGTSRVATAQNPKDLPHSYLFGAWIGGIYPPPTTLSARECMASPTVIFTRDAVLRANAMDVTFTQYLVETVRDSGRGVTEYRLLAANGAPMSAGPLGQGAHPMDDPGFGCGDPGLLRVQKRGENEIAFPNCQLFPYPLVRCASR